MLCFKFAIPYFRQSLFSSLSRGMVSTPANRLTIKFRPKFYSNSQRKHFSQMVCPNPIGGTVRKTGKFGLSLLMGATLLTSLGLYAQENENTSTSFRPIIFSSIEGRQWVEQCVELHPEILWLVGENVRKTEEDQAILQGTYSEQLFGQKYIEFDRTIMTIHCLKLILDGRDKAYELVKAVTIGLPFITRVLKEYQEMLMKKEIDSNIPLNFNKMAGLAKTSPEIFNKEFYIDKEGNIHL